MELSSLSSVLVEELGALKSSEEQLLEALPRLAAAAHAYELRDAFENHATETQRHLERVDEALASMGVRFAPARPSHAMRGLLEDSDVLIDATGDSVALDAALIGAAQRIEHFEIALYGSARSLADELGLRDVQALLGQTLDEEGRAAKLLTKIAEGGFMSSGINRLAATRSDVEAAEDAQPDQASAATTL
jgi:ferritin-like metal-binding protein YciE